MEITRTSFDSNYHFSQTINSPHGDYVRHEVDVWNHIKIGEVELCAMYQTGLRFKDFVGLSEELELSEDGGTHPLLIAVDRLSKGDIETHSEDAKSTLELLKKVVPSSYWSTLELLKKALIENGDSLCVEHYVPDDLVKE